MYLSNDVFNIRAIYIKNAAGRVFNEPNYHELSAEKRYQGKVIFYTLLNRLIWYAWHLPLLLVVPQTVSAPVWQTALTHVITAAGSIFSFTYLAYVYVKSESVFVTALAHIAMNNAGTALSYFTLIQNQLLANLGLVAAMGVVVAILYFTKELDVFARYFTGKKPMHDAVSLPLRPFVSGREQH